MRRDISTILPSVYRVLSTRFSSSLASSSSLRVSTHSSSSSAFSFPRLVTSTSPSSSSVSTTSTHHVGHVGNSSRGSFSYVEGDARDARAYTLALKHASGLSSSSSSFPLTPSTTTLPTPPPMKAHLLLTDPPYCLLTRRRKGGDLRDPKQRIRKLDSIRSSKNGQPQAQINHQYHPNQDDIVVRYENVREFRTFTSQWLETAVQFLHETAPLILWTNSLGEKPLLEACHDLGYTHLVGEFLWCKDPRRDGGGGGHEMLLRVYEKALIVTRKREDVAPRANSELAVPWSIVTGYHEEAQSVSSSSSSAAAAAADALVLHPHIKPKATMLPLILAWSKPGYVVLDPFAGTNVVGESCVQTGRVCAGIELKPPKAIF